MTTHEPPSNRSRIKGVGFRTQRAGGSGVGWLSEGGGNRRACCDFAEDMYEYFKLVIALPGFWALL